MSEKSTAILKGVALPPDASSDTVALRFADRTLWRQSLVTAQGRHVDLDLAQPVRVVPGDAVRLASGDAVRVEAMAEDLVAVRAGDLMRLAWHLGHRRAPCQISEDHLLILPEPATEALLQGLGATLVRVRAPFCPDCVGSAAGGGTSVHHHGTSHPKGAAAEDDDDEPPAETAARG